MSRHRSPSYDDLLKAYIKGEELPSFPIDEDIVIAQRDLRRRIDSNPPPSSLTESRNRVLNRVSDTGSYDVRALENELRTVIERAAAEKLVEEIKRREKAEEALNNYETEKRKFWNTIIAGVLIAIIVSTITWITITLIHVSK
jgi:uncharacterized membrane protein YraQ (UPF0718 family)